MVRVLYEALGDISGNQSGWQVGPSVPLRGQSPATLTCPLCYCAGCYTGSRWGCLTQLQPLSWCDGSSLSHLQSAEVVLQGHLRLQGSLFLLQVHVISSVHSSALLTPLLPSVCAWWGSCCLWLWGTAGCPWNQPSSSFTASLKSCSLLTTSCSPATGHPLPQHTFCSYSSTEILFAVLLSGLETSSQLQMGSTAMHRTLP